MVVMTDLLSLIWAAFDVARLFCCVWCIGPSFLMRPEATHRVSGSSRLDAVVTATRSGRVLGDGTGEQIQTLGYDRRVFGFDLK